MIAKMDGKSPKKENTEALNGETAKSQLPIGKAPEETFSLHVKGPKWIKDRDNSESKLKKMNARITKVRHPRQKSADYVYLDFASAEERDEALKELLPVDGIYVQLARKDNPEVVEKRIAKVQAKREARQQLKALRKNIAKNEEREKHPDKQKKLSNQVVIMNLPKVTTKLELNEHFENVVDVKLNVDKNPNRKFSKATITLATPTEALNASKKAITLHGIALKIQVHRNKDEVIKLKKKEKAKKRKLTGSDEKGTENVADEPKPKRPLVLAPEKPIAEKKAVKAANSIKSTKATKAVKGAKPTKAKKAVVNVAVKGAKPTKAGKVAKMVINPVAVIATTKKSLPAKKTVKAKK